MASPKPRPAHLKVLGGRSPGRDSGGRKIVPPPPFVRCAPDPPSWLSREAKAEWLRVVPELERLRLLTRVTRASLTAYCETWARFVQATQDVQVNGLTVTNRSIRKDGSESEWTVTNPAVGIAMAAQQALRMWATEFGLTPSSEGKLHVPEAETNEADFD